MKQPVISAEEAILQALAGHCCSVCDSPLLPNLFAPTYHFGPPAASDPHVCCGRAHCPYCNAPHDQRCPHLYAIRRDALWSIPRVLTPDSEPTIGDTGIVTMNDLVIPSDTTLHAAFGELAAIVRRVYFSVPSPASTIPQPETLANELIKREHGLNEQAVHNDEGDWVHYVFAEDAVERRRQVRQTVRRVRAGLDRLRTTGETSGCEWLGLLPLPDGIRIPRLQLLRFAPYRPLLLAAGNHGFVIWDTESGRIVGRGNNAAAPELWYYDASFGEGDTLTLHRCRYHGAVGAVDTAEPVPGERWHWQTGTRCGTVPVEWRGDAPQTPVPARHASIVLPATVRTAALHGGEVTLQVVNNHLGFEDFHSFTLTALAFTFRDRITHLDVASDGQTFALAVGGFVLLGRIPG